MQHEQSTGTQSMMSSEPMSKRSPFFYKRNFGKNLRFAEISPLLKICILRTLFHIVGLSWLKHKSCVRVAQLGQKHKIESLILQGFCVRIAPLTLT